MFNGKINPISTVLVYVYGNGFAHGALTLATKVMRFLST